MSDMTELKQLAMKAIEAEIVWAKHWMHLREIAPAFDYIMGFRDTSTQEED